MKILWLLVIGAGLAMPAAPAMSQSGGQGPSHATANERGPFPALMNSLFGHQRPTGAPAPRFERPADRTTAPRPRVERTYRPGRETAPRRPTHDDRVGTAHAGPSARRAMDPRYEPRLVSYSGSEAPGTIVVDTGQRFLYLVQEDGTAMRYGVGVGREGFSWTGREVVTRKAEWPSWRPPEAMKRRQPGLPDYMPGGPDNPLGARALYLGSTLYRIHGSNEPWTIGSAVSSGCIRMRNQDVKDLYERVSVGTEVVVR